MASVERRNSVMYRGNVEPHHTVWRHMSFPKFMDMLENQHLFFPSIKCLQQADPLEGKFSELVRYLLEGRSTNRFSVILANMAEKPDRPASRVDQWGFETPWGTVKICDPDTTLSEVLCMQSRWIDVQCWHRSEFENSAMWKVYGGEGPSVCVRSSVASIERALQPSDGTRIVIGPIEYRGPNDLELDVDDEFSPYLIKSKPYEYEQELRVLAYCSSDDYHADRAKNGRTISIDVGILVEEVILSPKSEGWFERLVKSVIEDKTCASVRRSDVGIR